MEAITQERSLVRNFLSCLAHSLILKSIALFCIVMLILKEYNMVPHRILKVHRIVWHSVHCSACIYAGRIFPCVHQLILKQQCFVQDKHLSAQHVCNALKVLQLVSLHLCQFELVFWEDQRSWY